VHDLTHKRDPRAELTGQTDPRDQPQPRVLIHRRHKTIGDVRDRVEKYRTEKNREPSPEISHHSPENSSDQHPPHLHLQQPCSNIEQLIPLQPKRFQARHANDAEENQVINIYEISKRGHDDRRADGVPRLSRLFHGDS
jgi:hypothetical protein